jgi:hypothetical protein
LAEFIVFSIFFVNVSIVLILQKMENLKGRRFLPYSEMILILTGLVLHIVTFSIDSSNTNFFKAKRLVLRLIRILVIGIKISSTADLIEMRS